ncbi:MAG TPA: alkaline phosphatase family protein [Gemmatimonadaceae bacterium]|nr:alkaline phosphatase family protein [Gemmatimonadaceae bacterium]
MPRAALLLAFLLLSGSHARAQVARTASGPAAPPSLVVLITVDQLRGDYLDRFASQLKGGFGRLTRGGAWFTNAHHDHAITETAPGHATLLSGRFPRSTGISANDAGVFDETSPLLGAPTGAAGGASPARFQGSTLVDWLHARDSRSRVLSVSMKDRGAILPVGRSRAEVYWYLPDGRFTTSRYYRDSLPQWVTRFNARRLPQSYAGRSWVPMLPDSAYREADSVYLESRGIDPVFPHVLPADSAAAAGHVRLTPWMDEITLALALDGLRELSLGAGPQTDLLAVSLSATDLIGHSFGPDSKEIHDQMLRLDRSLGVFIDSLYRVRDSLRVAIVLSSDHGVGKIPELAVAATGQSAERVNLAGPVARLRARLIDLGLKDDAFDVNQRTARVNRTRDRGRDAAIDAALNAFAGEARRVPGVARVDRFRNLIGRDTLTDPVARRWAHQFPPASGVELAITLTPFSIFGSIVATHGSPYDYDTNVPLIFYGPAFTPGRYSGFVRTVDLAPTLAQITGVVAGEKLDGVVLRQAIR